MTKLDFAQKQTLRWNAQWQQHNASHRDTAAFAVVADFCWKQGTWSAGEKASSAMAAAPPAVGKDLPDVTDGFVEVDFGHRQKMTLRQPPNIDVAEAA